MRAHEIAPSLLRYVKGECYDFALAALERFPQGELVCVGPAGKDAEHVGVKVGDSYLDARGHNDAESFAAPFGYNASDIAPIGRAEVELCCGLAGVPPPYRGNRDIANARKAVAQVFGRK